MPLRILIVEDEMTIALLLEDMVTDLGHQVAGMAMRLPQALALAETAEVDLAILDVNLDGLLSFPVADVLERRGVPYVFATGYGPEGIEPAYKGHVVIRKPFVLNDVQTALAHPAG
jgi:CheY-like chemotaxis protein